MAGYPARVVDARELVIANKKLKTQLGHVPKLCPQLFGGSDRVSGVVYRAWMPLQV